MAEKLKLVWHPSVHLVSCPAVHFPGVDSFLESIEAAEWSSDAETPGDLLPELAGRNCYQSYKNNRPGGNTAYLKHILEVGHLSVLEHANYSFLITGVSRSLTHELIRHRHLSFSQLSQRYVDESDVAFVIPPVLIESARFAFDPNSNVHASVEDLKWANTFREPFYLWRDACLLSLSLYKDLLGRLDILLPNGLSATEKTKSSRQAARSVLPNSTETKIFVTGNLRAWRNFLELRCSRYADVEIRRLANYIYPLLLQEAPNAMSGHEMKSLQDGTYELIAKN